MTSAISGLPLASSALTDNVGQNVEQQRHAKLVDAAQKFEGMLLQEILKPMQKSQDAGFGEDPDSDRDSSLDTMSSFGTEAVADAIAKSGGLGIAKQVLRKVSDLDTRTKSGQGRY